MPRHSKNNTASAVFTYAERDRLTYGTKTQRLGGDSKRPFDACFLCLTTAVDPMSCPEGHVACKECIFESILAQKREIARTNDALEDARAKAELREREREIDAARAKVAQAEASISLTGRAREADAAKKAALPSFWIPSLTPSAAADADTAAASAAAAAAEKRAQVQCLSSAPHALSAKKLFAVKFQRDATTKKPTCPSCAKSLAPSAKVHALRACGHVLCDKCVTSFVKASKQCTLCDTKCRPRDIVALATEGTGFAASGQVEAKKFDHAFL
ncbi:hypothetical protein H9P43_001307 [Blastocladiella emersonii ATCC 22665]|nr:hypothetical protein H9P43_001307 [Blastocladiella emersonii ATCC 22665]